MHIDIVADERHDLAVVIEYALDGLGGLVAGELMSEVERLRGVKQLYRKYFLAVVDDAHKFRRSVGTHADVILLTL